MHFSVVACLTGQTAIIWGHQIKKALDPYNISHAQFVIMAVTLWFENNHRDVTQIMIIKQSKLDKMTVKVLKKISI